MRRFFYLLMLIGVVVSSCTKDFKIIKDYRDNVVGDYDGFRLFTDENSVSEQFDAVNASISLIKSTTNDSVIDVYCSPNHIDTVISFKYVNGEFISLNNLNHPPVLTLSGESINFYHRPGEDPIWYQFYVNKIL